MKGRGYREFLDTGKPPSYRASRKRSPETASKATANEKAALLEIGSGSTTPTPIKRMVDYRFPLRSGTMANLRLPARFEREDAERLAAFIRTLVFEPMKQITTGVARFGSASAARPAVSAGQIHSCRDLQGWCRQARLAAMNPGLLRAVCGDAHAARVVHLSRVRLGVALLAAAALALGVLGPASARTHAPAEVRRHARRRPDRGRPRHASIRR